MATRRFRGGDNAAIRFDVAATSADMAKLAREWEELALASRRPVTPFQRPGWSIACASLMEKGLLGGMPAVLTGRRNGRLVCMAPLALHNSGGTVRAEWIGGRFAAYGDVLVGAAEDETALVRYLLEEMRRHCSWASLEGVREDSTLAACLHPGHFERSAAAPYLDLSGFVSPGDFDRSRSRATRKTWQRKERKLAELGDAGFAYVAGAAALESIGDLFAMKRKWAHGNGVLSRSINDPAFERLIAGLAARERDIRISTLSLGGRPVAMELGMVAGSRYLSYLCAYDTELSALSPGVLQMRRTIEAAIAEGVTRFDLMPPADPYKLQWTALATPVLTLRMTFARSPVAAAMARLHAADLPRRAAGAVPARLRPALARAAAAGHKASLIVASMKSRAAAILAAAVSLAGATAFVLAAAE